MSLHEWCRRKTARNIFHRSKIKPCFRGLMLRQNALGVVPGARRGSVDSRINIENTPPIGLKRSRTFLRRKQTQEVLVQTRIETGQPIEKRAFQFAPRPQKRCA